MTIVYLAGPINACSDDEVTSWRARARHELDPVSGIIDPADRDFRGFESESLESIVEGDKADIDEADVVFAYCWQPSYGTAMELLYAWERDKCVVVVVPDVTLVSPWVRYHASKVYGVLTEALDYVLDIA